MTGAEASYYLRKLAFRFKFTRLVEILLISSGFAALTYALVRLTSAVPFLPLVAAALTFGLVLTWRIIRTDVLAWDDMRAALFLSNCFPELKESTDLLVKTQSISTLEELQRLQVLNVLDTIKARVRIPNRIVQSLLILVVGVVAYWLLPAARMSSAVTRAPETVLSSAKPVKIIPELQKISNHVVPPAYTRIKSHWTSGADFSAPVNSMVTWSISFRGEALEPRLILSALDTIRLDKDKDKDKEGQYRIARTLKQNSFYQVAWKDDGGKLHLSDFHRMDVVQDAAPVVEINNLIQFLEVRPGDPMQIAVKAGVSDDYGVSGVHLVATVSKGSGESVKFREEKLYFDQPGPFGKRADLSRSIDLIKLGLEPGDELYFYAEASDNLPTPNVSRTETFFIALQDTAVAVAVADSGLGVDLMPEYFRSQRQIIIDTEKLLAEQRRIKKLEFNSRSNELGYDQKTLRLRYGQFLGEEDEAGIGVVSAVPVEEEEEADPMAKFGHQHDTKNEHNLVADKKAEKSKDEHGHDEDSKEEDPMKAFIHEHDTGEESTFFIQSIKTKLKAALTLMWDSELHLRMYEPKKSLPFQYRILALLKEISQDSRVYVHRTGFDPPPIKEEKRLTGELTEVFNSTERVAAAVADEYPAVRAALAHVEGLLQESEPALTDSMGILASRAGYEVAAEELRQPGRYIQTLSILRRLADQNVPQADIRPTLVSLRKSFWSILPLETYSPHRTERTLHPLDRAVLQNLEKKSRE